MKGNIRPTLMRSHSLGAVKGADFVRTGMQHHPFVRRVHAQDLCSDMPSLRGLLGHGHGRGFSLGNICFAARNLLLGID